MQFVLESWDERGYVRTISLLSEVGSTPVSTVHAESALHILSKISDYMTNCDSHIGQGETPDQLPSQ